MRERIHRWLSRRRALVGVGIRRVAGQPSTRVLVTITGIAIAVALLVTIGGVSLGLAGGTVVAGETVDYWIVPDGATARSVVVGVDGPRLGQVHEVTNSIASDDRVAYATPVQVTILPVSAGNRTEYAVLMGVIGPPDGQDSEALPGAALSPSDPHYANGSYAGPRTGEAVVSGATAELLAVGNGDSLALRGDRFTVRAVEDEGLAGELTTAPVVVVHLAELQAATGADEGDLADRILVRAHDRSVRESIGARYPETDVVTGTGLGRDQLSEANLPLAMAIAATITTLVVGVLFVATLMGLEVTDDRRQLAVLAAIGLSGRSRAWIVGTQTIVVAAIGGVAGVGLGIATIAAVNGVAARVAGLGRVALFDPLLIAVGLGVALAIGALAVVYPLWVARRTDPLEAMAR
ncbi:ABC transporter permease [Halococcoides cellulosivorans]|uniref:ABC transporter permease n=1 Tax=Halococcoides cellulosivorans TaxID=1679096 RepID=A0A2R4WZV2_9EURY|nr:ABC transporter permease [Halococcoides cellulosivorans]AWB27082.1 ABC transporter permease [Halococcoides cellulosivorans]